MEKAKNLEGKILKWNKYLILFNMYIFMRTNEMWKTDRWKKNQNMNYENQLKTTNPAMVFSRLNLVIPAFLAVWTLYVLLTHLIFIVTQFCKYRDLPNVFEFRKSLVNGIQTQALWLQSLCFSLYVMWPFQIMWIQKGKINGFWLYRTVDILISKQCACKLQNLNT